jgi:excisionase family DNA binding protein
MTSRRPLTANPPDHLLTLDEAASRLRISPRHLQRLTADQRIPCVRLGRAVRYDAHEITAVRLRARR